LNPSNLLTQGEELPESNATQPRPNQDATATTTKAAYEAELAKLRREAEELAKTRKKLLAIQQGAEAAKEIQRHKAEIAKLQEELRTIKAKQSLSFNQPLPEYSVPNQSTFTEGNVPFTQPPRFTIFSRNPFVNPFDSGPSNHDVHTIRTRSWDPKSLCLRTSRSLRGHNPTGMFHSLGFRVYPIVDNS
jgi:hypothetical protein